MIVCDVCGDVGDKKKLAVCSRCNDGAQHTYALFSIFSSIFDNNGKFIIRRLLHRYDTDL